MTEEEARSIIDPVADAHSSSLISTGSVGLDVSLGGGWPFRGSSELYGPPSCGKSTLGYLALASAQRADPRRVGLVDSRRSFDPAYAERQGVDLDRLLLLPRPPLIRSLHWDLSFAVVDPFLWEESDGPVPQPPADRGVLYITEQRSVIMNYGLSNFRWSQTARSAELPGTTATVRLSVERNKTWAEVLADSRRPPVDFPRRESFRIGWGRGIDRADELVGLGLDCALIQPHGNWLIGGALGSGEMGYRIKANGYAQARWQVEQTPETAEWLERNIRERMIGSLPGDDMHGADNAQ